jgi:hypothetical protein
MFSRTEFAGWGHVPFLAIDPGVRVLGWALFSYGDLHKCGLSEVDHEDPAITAPLHKERLVSKTGWPDRRVCERMVVRGGRSPVPPSDLLNVQLVAGHLGTHWLTPAQWKGSVSRQTEQNRTKSKLTAWELKLVREVTSQLREEGLAHNMLSAIGIGIKVLDRKALR